MDTEAGDVGKKPGAATGVVDHPAEIDRNPCKFPDVLFGLGWIASVIAMAAVAFEYSDEVGDRYDDDDSKKKHAARNMLKIFILSFFFALVVSQLALSVMMRFGGTMIHVSMVICEVLLLTCGVVAVNVSRWFVAFAFFALFGSLLLFHVCSVARIRYAAVTLHVGTRIVLAFPVLQLVAFVTAVVSVVFIFVFALAIFGYWNHQTANDAAAGKVVVVLLVFLFIFFWSQQVFKYVLTGTTAATAQAWWYGETPSVANHPALNGLARNCTYNLGSICFGAAVVAVVETLVVAVQYLKKKATNAPGVGCCVRCLLGCVQCCLACCAAVMDYVNKYAFAYVGMHGYSYLYAGKKVVDLFAHHGFTAIGADFFVDTVLFANHVIVGVVTAAFGVLLVNKGPDSWHKHSASPEVAAGLICGIGGLAISGIIFAVVDGANKATLILFADNPHVLEHTHPDEFALISKVWAMLGKEIKDDEDD